MSINFEELHNAGYKTVREAAEINGLNYYCLRDRLRKGMPLEEALDKNPLPPPNEKHLDMTDSNGHIFHTYKEIASYANLTVKQVKNRISHGWDIDEIINVPAGTKRYQNSKQGNHHKECMDHHGIKYGSFTEMCAAYGKKSHIVKDRLRRGSSLKDSLEKDVVPRQKGIYDHNGRFFPDMKKMAEHYATDYNLLKARLQLGWSVEEALLTPANKPRPKENNIEKEKKSNRIYRDHKGKPYRTLKELAKSYGITVYTLKKRLEKGMTLEEALTAPKRNKGNTSSKIIINGKGYRSLSEVAREYGINRGTIEQRRRAGMTLEQAVEKEVIIHQPRNTPVTVQGKTYKCLGEACKAYNRSYDTALARINLGWNIEESVRIPNIRGLFASTRQKPLFEMDGEGYYRFKCPECENEYVFTAKEMRQHYLTHLK